MYDMSRQPKWVQEEVASLERKVRSLEAEVQELRSEETVSYAGDLTWQRPVGLDLPKQWGIIETLPQGTHVYFKAGRRNEFFTVMQKRHDQKILEVRASYSGIVVKPEASNVVSIYLEDRG